MSVRDFADVAPGLRASEQLDDVTMVVAALLARMDAAYSALDGLADGLGSMLEPDQRVALERALLALRPGGDEATKRLKERAARSKTLGQDALDAFLAERERAKRAEPWIPPRGTARRPGDTRIPYGVAVQQIDPDGKTWGQTPDRPPDPLDHI